MRIIRNPELKGILVILLIALVLGVLLAGMSGKLEQWGLPWFTGARVVDKIIFVSDRSGAKEIYIMNLDGSDQEQLTNGAQGALGSRDLPDGQQDRLRRHERLGQPGVRGRRQAAARRTRSPRRPAPSGSPTSAPTARSSPI